MASYGNTRTDANGTQFGANLTPAVNRVIGRIAAWNEARVTRNALSKLTDYELDDIGLTRADVYEIR